jgi:signal peptidase II
MARSPSRSSSASAGGPSIWLWLAVALVVIVLDEFVKQLIVGGFAVGESRTVTSFFNVVRWHNTGAAFSFLAGSPGWQRWLFIGLALAASVGILVLLRLYARQTLFCFAITMVMGGALGNAIDRMVRGYVVDFISLHWKDVYTFPAFNLADSAITLGAICLILDELRRVRRS